MITEKNMQRPDERAAATPLRRRSVPWLVVVIVLFVTGVAAVVSYGFYARALDASRQQSARQIAAIGALKADQLSWWFTECKAGAAAASTDDPFTRAVTRWLPGGRGALPSSARDYIGSLLGAQRFQSARLFDARVRPRWSSTGTLTPLDITQRQAAMAAIELGTVTFVDLHLDAGGAPSLGFVVPLRPQSSGDAGVSALLVLSVDPALFLYQQLQTWPVASTTAETVLVERFGDRVLFLSPTRNSSKAPLTFSVPIADTRLPTVRAALGGRGVVTGVDYRGKPVITSLNAVSGTPWLMVAKIDDHEVVVGARGAGVMGGAVLIVAIALGGIGVMWMWRRREAHALRRLYEAEVERGALRQRYELLTRHASDAIELYDESLTICDVNERALEMYGYERDEMLRLRFDELHPDQAPSTLDDVTAALAQSGSWLFEGLALRKSGEVVPVESHVRLTEVGGSRFVQAIVRDITERKRIQAELRHERDFSTAVVDTSAALVCVLDAGGDIVVFNRACQEVTGYSFAQVTGRPLGSGADVTVADLARAGGQRHPTEWLACAGGRRLIAWSNATVTRDDGQVDYVIMTGSDITDQSRIERTLDAFFSSSSAGLFILDRELRYVRVNGFISSLNRRAAEDHVGRRVREVVPRLAARLETIHRVVFDHGETAGDIRLFSPPHDESDPREWLMSCFPIRDAAGAVTYMGGVVVDVSDGRRARQLLSESEEKFRSLFEGSADGLLLMREDGVFVDCNEAACRMWGATREQIIGQGPLAFSPPVQPDGRPSAEAARAMNQAALEGETQQYQWRHRSLDGRDVDTEVTLTCVLVRGVPIIQATVRDVTERVRAERELFASREMLETILNNIPQRVFWKDTDLRYLGCNLSFALDAGFAMPDDIIGRSDTEMSWRDMAEMYRRDDREVLETGAAKLGFEEPLLRGDGARTSLRTSKIPIHDASGKVVGVLGTYEDVTEQKLSAERLARLTRLYKVLSGINEAIVRTSAADELFIEACRVLVEDGGFVMSAVSGRTSDGAIHRLVSAGEERGYFDEVIIESKPGRYSAGPTGMAIVKGRPDICADIEHDRRMVPWRKAALARGYRSCAAFPVRSGKDAVAVLSIYSSEVAFFNEEEVALLTQLADDVSFALETMRIEGERRAAAEALARSEQELLEAQRLGHVGSWRADPRTWETTWSDENYHILGRAPSEPILTGESFHEAVVPEDRERLKTLVVEALERREEATIEVSITRPDGERRRVALSLAVVTGDDGLPSEIVGTTVDLTDYRRMEEAVLELNAELEQRVAHRTAQLEAANRELEAFAYSVSHDLRAPLRALDGFSLALLEDYGSGLDATGQDYLRRVRAASQRMAQLIDDLLTLSRVSRREMAVDEVDVTAMARRTVERLRDDAPERVVEFEVADGLVDQADDGLLQIVLDNLLGNAWKFTGRNEVAHVSLARAREGSEDVYAVRDDGAGFDATYADKLFAPFQRLHGESEFSGTGIGLATVQRIIHRHGGRCWAEGAPGKGATVSFTLHPPTNGRKTKRPRIVETKG